MAVLPTNYLDDILAASMGGKRRFRITHEDGSTEEVTLEDVSEYEQVGSPFGSGDVNKTNQAVNEKLDSADVVDPALATVLGFAADEKLTGDALSELNKNINERIMIASERRVLISNESDGVPVIQSSDITYDEIRFLENLRTNVQSFINSVQSGSVTITTVEKGTATVNVTFPTAYAAGTTPNVVANVVTSLPDIHSVTVFDITNTGFKICLYRNATSANMTVKWIAIA